MNKAGIMQPYFLPYIGYFSLISEVDEFVVYDNIKYTKKGWINRNRILNNGKEKLISISLKKDSDFLNISERKISESFNRKKLLNQFHNAYFKSLYFDEINELLKEIILFEENNLFNYVFNSIKCVCKYLDIETSIKVSSELPLNHNLNGFNRVIDICKFLNSKQYINPIGGLEIYNRDDFKKNDIELFFLKPKIYEYSQNCKIFTPWMSIIDVLMYNSKNKTKEFLLPNYDLIRN